MADETEKTPLWAGLVRMHPEHAVFFVSYVVDLLGDKDASARASAAWEIEKVIGACDSVEGLGKLEKYFAQVARGFGDSAKPGDAPSYAVIKLAQLANRAASRKNLLARAGTDGLLLDEKPRPPKGGAIFQTTRRALTYG
jgi:hypothetical protein